MNPSLRPSSRVISAARPTSEPVPAGTSRNTGEPPVASACDTVLNAISDALGDEVFVRSPVLVDHIVQALDTKKIGQFPLTANV